jgi:hypothetical protein
MRLKPLLLMIALSACSMLPSFPGGGGGNTTTHSTQSESSSKTEEMHVNGRPVAVNDDDDDDHRGRGRSDDDDDDDDRGHSKKKSKKEDIGKTCHKNNECAFDACFVGNGDLGYCTKMCSSWSECPTHWECKRAGNAPQKICMQDD